MTGVLLGALLIIPGTVLSAELSQSGVEGAGSPIEGMAVENQTADDPAEWNLPEGEDECGIMPCGDWVDEKNEYDDN